MRSVTTVQRDRMAGSDRMKTAAHGHVSRSRRHGPFRDHPVHLVHPVSLFFSDTTAASSAVDVVHACARDGQSFGTGTSLTGVTVLVHRLKPGQRNF